MNRIKAILAFTHILLSAGAIIFYTSGSIWGVLSCLAGVFLRFAAPLEQNKKENFGLWSILGIIWTATLIQWLSTKGIFEFIESALEERFAPLPFALFISLLAGSIIKDWIYFLNLSDTEVDLYYSEESKT